MVTREKLELEDGRALIWTVANGRDGVARVEHHKDCITVTWATEWTTKDLLGLVEHARARTGRTGRTGRPAADNNDDNDDDNANDDDTARHPLPALPSKVDAILVPPTGPPQLVSTCKELLALLADKDANWIFVRIEISQGTLVWAKKTPLDGWKGATLGVIVDIGEPSYVRGIFSLSAVPALEPLGDGILEEAGA